MPTIIMIGQMLLIASWIDKLVKDALTGFG
jgi:hypothetical protein